MQPKFIIIKITSKNFYSLLVRELTNYKRLKYIAKKINGEYTVIIKCQNYYKYLIEKDFKFSKSSDSTRKIKNNLYFGYIYLYTNISLILSELIIKYFESKLANQILNTKYNYLSKAEISRVSNIIHTVLDSNYPSIDSKKLYLYRKDLILNKLLLNFRNRNYIYVNHFAYFKLSDYHNHLEEVVDKTFERCTSF